MRSTYIDEMSTMQLMMERRRLNDRKQQAQEAIAEPDSDHRQSLEAAIADYESEICEVTERIEARKEGANRPQSQSVALRPWQRPTAKIELPSIEFGIYFNRVSDKTPDKKPEVIRPEAFNVYLRSGRNVRIVVAHDRSLELASLDAGNLVLKVDETAITAQFSLMGYNGPLGLVVGNIVSSQGRLRGCSPCLGKYKSRDVRIADQTVREVYAADLEELSLGTSPVYQGPFRLDGQTLFGTRYPGLTALRSHPELYEIVMAADR